MIETPLLVYRRIGLGMLAIGAALALSNPAIAAETSKPVFTKDIAPIFQAKCQDCHRKGSMAPMSLETYQEARPWAKAIQDRVATRQMPPWHIDKTVGIQHFANDRSLERRTDRDHREMGRRGFADGRIEGHAAGEEVRRR